MGGFTEQVVAIADGETFASDTDYNLTFSITRTATGNDVEWAITGGALDGILVSGSDTGGNNAPFYQADTLTFAVLSGGNSIDDWKFDQITVDYTPIPEPGTIAVLVLGLGGMVLARRRR